MTDQASQIREHMAVLGQHVGTVDAVEGARIKLTRNDPAAGGEHHYLHLDMVAHVDGDAVHLTRTAQQARDEWASRVLVEAGRREALRPDRRRRGPKRHRFRSSKRLLVE